MTNLDFQGICGLHDVSPADAIKDKFVVKILKADKKKNQLFNHITLSTYLATDEKYKK